MFSRKKIWFLSLCSLFLLVSGVSANSSPAPSFEADFAKKLTSDTADKRYGTEKVFSFSCVKKDQPFIDNVKCLFFPWVSPEGKAWGFLWEILRYAGMIIVFIYIVYAAIQLIVSGKDANQLKNAMTNLLYVLVGSALFFGAMWLFGTVLNLNEVRTTAGLRDNLISSNGILFFVLSFLKGAAFFIAIIMIVITGFRMMNPQSGESWDGKKLAKNLVNVIFALVAMKVIDFIYYIASQQNSASQAGNFIIQVAKFLAYVSGSVIVLMIIYSGYLLVVDGGKGENFKKAKNTLINIVFAVAALFFFLFILYQIFSEFN